MFILFSFFSVFRLQFFEDIGDPTLQKFQILSLRPSYTYTNTIMRPLETTDNYR